MADVGRDLLEEALQDALALAHEFDGAAFDRKMAAFGIDYEDVLAVANDSYRATLVLTPELELESFSRGFIEGLLAGVVIQRRTA